MRITKRSSLVAFALLTLVGCKDATAALPKSAPTGTQARATVLFSAAGVPVLSVRRVVPGLYSVRASIASGKVSLIIRVAPASYGFPQLTSGTEMVRMDQTEMVETQIATQPGNRYMAVSVPGESDPALFNPSLAVYTEFVP